MKDLVQTIFDLALERVSDRYQVTPISGPELEAEVTCEMLRYTRSVETNIKATKAVLAVYAGRERIWQNHPSHPSSLREFLLLAGMSESTASELGTLSEIVVPFCDSENIQVDDLVGPRQWHKTREALTALKRAANEEDAGRVAEILSDVRQTVGPSAYLAIRSKYRSTRTDTVGHGTTMHLPDGRIALLVVYDEDGDCIKTAVRRLGGPVKWDLRATPHRGKRLISYE
jgi:hypothetical protein